MKLILKYSCMLFFISFFSVLSLMFVKDLKIQFILSITGMILSTIFILYAKKKVGAFIKPSDEILENIGIEPINVAYNPNKFKKSSTILGYMPYLIIISNIFSYLAYKFSTIVKQPDGYDVLIIQDDYMLLSILFVMIGFVCFVLWAKLKQTYCIFSEQDDMRRGRLNAFALSIQEQAQKLNLYYQLYKVSGKK